MGLFEMESLLGCWPASCALLPEGTTLLVAPTASANMIIELQFMGLGICEEPGSWYARGAPHLLGLHRLRSMPGEAATDMTGICVCVPDDGVALRIRRESALGDKQLPCSSAIPAAPVSFVELELVPFVLEGWGCG